ncbi:MAG: hypothetical protein BRC52_01600 [Cyanobacteria bacterium SW_5_48_44]|nr:MAG: hypothetical protein BRC52_01600 [Cyanobacteria bacterium SW_5_48_44]
MEAVGARVILLAPYSRDLSPMEWCWSKLKQWWLVTLQVAMRDCIKHSP